MPETKSRTLTTPFLVLKKGPLQRSSVARRCRARSPSRSCLVRTCPACTELRRTAGGGRARAARRALAGAEVAAAQLHTTRPLPSFGDQEPAAVEDRGLDLARPVDRGQRHLPLVASTIEPTGSLVGRQRFEFVLAGTLTSIVPDLARQPAVSLTGVSSGAGGPARGLARRGRRCGDAEALRELGDLSALSGISSSRSR